MPRSVADLSRGSQRHDHHVEGPKNDVLSTSGFGLVVLHHGCHAQGPRRDTSGVISRGPPNQTAWVIFRNLFLTPSPVHCVSSGVFAARISRIRVQGQSASFFEFLKDVLTARGKRDFPHHRRLVKRFTPATAPRFQRGLTDRVDLTSEIRLLLDQSRNMTRAKPLGSREPADFLGAHAAGDARIPIQLGSEPSSLLSSIEVE